jgi:peptidoglycan hydrolase-like protein with peptidoglycan-binding domain
MSVKKHAKRLMLLPVLAAGLSVSPFVSKGATATSTPAKKKSASSSSTRKSGGKTTGKSSKRSRKEVGQKAPTTERVSEIQQALAKDGSYAGTPNGQWDGSTVDAMRKFQSTHGLNASGRLDAKTLQGLGLGSKTAGVAAPTVNATSRLQSSRATLTDQQN